MRKRVFSIIVTAFCALTAVPALGIEYDFNLGLDNQITAGCPKRNLSPSLIIQDCALFIKAVQGTANFQYDLRQIAEALFFMGTAYVRQGQTDLAAKHFSAALNFVEQYIAKNPNEAVSRNNRCWIRAVAGIDLDKALEDCQSIMGFINSMPTPIDTLEAYAFVLYRQGKYQEALDGYNRALQVNGDSASALFMRGVVELQLGKESVADADIKLARDKDSDIDKLINGYGIKVK